MCPVCQVGLHNSLADWISGRLDELPAWLIKAYVEMGVYKDERKDDK